MNSLNAKRSTLNATNLLSLNAKRSTLNAGFTLVETLLVLLMFSAIAILMGGAFVSSLELQRRAVNIQQAEDNASYILEVMAKEIRVSHVISPDASCPALPPALPAETLRIQHPVNGDIVYSLSGGAIHRSVNGVDSVISSNTVEFTRLQFCTSGIQTEDPKQSRVTIIAGLKSSKYKGKALPQEVITDIQTTLSQRYLSN